MTPDEKELADLLRTYHNEIVSLARENTAAIGQLDSARKEFVKKGWFERHREWILPILVPASMVIIGIAAVSITKSSIKIGDVTISKQQDCPASLQVATSTKKE
ncbi:MAG: hypothetical protein ABIB04_02510 [Patescibacteria group bacterium]